MPENDHQLLKKTAQRMGRSFSDVIREAIRFYLDHIIKRPSWEDDPLWALAGAGKADRKNTDSRDHDRLLYGGRK